MWVCVSATGPFAVYEKLVNWSYREIMRKPSRNLKIKHSHFPITMTWIEMCFHGVQLWIFRFSYPDEIRWGPWKLTNGSKHGQHWWQCSMERDVMVSCMLYDIHKYLRGKWKGGYRHRRPIHIQTLTHTCTDDSEERQSMAPLLLLL